MNKPSEKFEALVRDLVPINGLPPQYQNEVINYSQVGAYKRRQFVFKQGDRDNFSYYLLEGDLSLYADEQRVEQLSGGTQEARYAMAQLQPRQMSAQANTAISVLKVDRHMLDRLLTMDEKGGEGEVEVSEIDSEESVDWMTRLLQSELFARIPPANIQPIFTTLESVEVSKGEVIVRQGAPGDYYYLIQKGRCEVSCQTSDGSEPITLAELDEGDSFGEEALVSDVVRNASITMMSDGELMRLTKEDFVDLIKRPVLNSVSYLKAESQVAGGATWLDVRFLEEHQDSGIEGSLNIPLNVLRARLSELDTNASYVVYCDTGGRSSVAAFLLTQNGMDVSYLSGGLMKSPMAPDAKAKADVAPSEPVRAEKPKERPGKRSKEEAVKKTPPAAKEAPRLEADIRASALDAELVKANLQIEDALKQKAQAEQARQRSEEEAKRKVQAEREKLEQQAAKLRNDAEAAKRNLAEAAKGKIKQEREKLEAEAQRLKEEAEAAKQAAEEVAEQRIQEEREKLEARSNEASRALEEAHRLKLELAAAKKKAKEEAEQERKFEEQRLEALKREAAERLKRESDKLEEEYARNAEELARIKRESEEAEEKLRHERSKVDEQAVEVREKLDEARKLKQETEASRRAVELEVEQKIKAQEELERKMRVEVNKKLKEERRKLEAEFARQAGEMERIQAEREAAEAARRAAQEEADRIIAEYKEQHEKTIAKNEQQLRVERERLEREAQDVQATLEEARKAKQEAESTRQEAERQMKELGLAKAKAERVAKTEEEEEKLRAEIAAIDAEVDQANEQLEAAEKAQQEAEAAKRANEEDISQQKDAEEVLREQLAAEATAWELDYDKKAREVEKAHDMVLEQEQIQRIKRRATEARRHADEANDNMLDDVHSQLD